MAESQFINIVSFGGYDKNEVDSRFSELNEQIIELRNKLRQSEILLDEYKKGTDEEKANQTVLNEERSKLTKIQVENKTLSDKLKISEDNNKKLNAEVEKLNSQLNEVTKKCTDAENKIEAYESGNDPSALSAVFIEAQKSANMLVEKSKKEAAKIDSESKTAAEEAVKAANNKAKKIVYEAEKHAAEIISEAKNNSEKMNAASGNLKTLILSDVDSISTEIDKVKEVLESFREMGLNKIKEADSLLNKTAAKLKEGGVPVFKNPENIEPEYPAQPEYEKVADGKSVEKTEEQNDELSKLMAMAEALGNEKSDDKKADKTKAEKTDNKKSSDGGMTLDEIMAQAEALNK